MVPTLSVNVPAGPVPGPPPLGRPAPGSGDLPRGRLPAQALIMDEPTAALGPEDRGSRNSSPGCATRATPSVISQNCEQVSGSSNGCGSCAAAASRGAHAPGATSQHRAPGRAHRRTEDKVVEAGESMRWYRWGWSPIESARAVIASTARGRLRPDRDPALDPSSVDARDTRLGARRLRDGAGCSLGLSAETNVSSEDPAAVAAGRRLARRRARSNVRARHQG